MNKRTHKITLIVHTTDDGQIVDPMDEISVNVTSANANGVKLDGYEIKTIEEISPRGTPKGGCFGGLFDVNLESHCIGSISRDSK